MQEWTLKAASTKSTPSDVRGLAVSGFVCCTPCKANGNPVPLVHDVQMRDVLHLYFAKKGEPFQAIGSFEVTSYKEHKQPMQFQDKWSGIPIVEVVDPKLCKLLTLSGYKRDPSLRTFAGWCVRLLRRTTPQYTATRLATARPTDFLAPIP